MITSLPRELDVGVDLSLKQLRFVVLFRNQIHIVVVVHDLCQSLLERFPYILDYLEGSSPIVIPAAFIVQLVKFHSVLILRELEDGTARKMVV
jgi:hypothetical protein